MIALSCVAGFIAGCSRGDSKGAGRVENAQTWAPDKLTSVEGVPASEIEALIQKKLDGPRLPRIDDDQWGNDLYNRDDKLVPIVMAGAMPSKEIVDAVQALRRIASA